MSANNYLYITQKGKEYVVSSKDADTSSGFEIGRASTFKEAKEKAYDWAKENPVEYGLKIDDKILNRL